MNFETENYPRYVRPGLLLLGAVCYGFFIYVLLEQGHLALHYHADLVFVSVWFLGLAALILVPDRYFKGSHDLLNFARALWCNIGAVTLALFVPHMLRLLLLAVPLFGVIFAAIHLSRERTFIVAATTALIYVVHVLNLAAQHEVSLEFESISALAFAALLGGTLFLGIELQRVRERLMSRNKGLREAMERLQDLASRDDLTGLLNRRAVMDVLGRQKALVDRGQAAFTLCYCDLDYFKQVNDKFGHGVGDLILRQFADLAKAEVRNVDYVARFGGEEFLLVLVDTDVERATQVAQRLVDRTREMWVPEIKEAFSLSVSIGVASYQVGEPVEQLIRRGDHALYEAKGAGRDQVFVSR